MYKQIHRIKRRGSLYGYSGGFGSIQPSTMTPGYGYWIKLTCSRTDNHTRNIGKGGEPVEYFPEDWGKIILTDATGINYTLYAVKGEVDLDVSMNYHQHHQQECLISDISSGRIAEDLNSAIKTIDMSGVTYPLTVRVEGMDIRLMDETGKTVNVNLKAGEDIVISDATIQKLMVSGELILQNMH